MAITVLEQPKMERDWTERRFFSDVPDWLKEAMCCDAINPLEGSDPQEWEVGYYADHRAATRRVAKPGALIIRDAYTGKLHVGEVA